MLKQITIRSRGKQLQEITEQVCSIVDDAGTSSGVCTVFIQHTSASLIIQENADPSARRDLETWLDKLVPEGDPLFTHTFEGSDDMPSHIKSALTQTSLSIPIMGGKLVLGTWQGIYLWEHRSSGHNRSVVVHISG